MGGVGEGEDADEVDEEAGHGDGEEALRAHVGGVEEPAEALDEDVERDHGEEEAVHEAGEDLEAVVAGKRGSLNLDFTRVYKFTQPRRMIVYEVRHFHKLF